MTKTQLKVTVVIFATPQLEKITRLIATPQLEKITRLIASPRFLQNPPYPFFTSLLSWDFW